MTNGYKTYSKTPFKETKHKRGAGGTFEKKAETEKDKVSYHYEFNPKGHKRGQDGSFSNGYTSDDYINNASDSVKTGLAKYGS